MMEEKPGMILLNPKKLSLRHPDKRSAEVMASTVDFFEKKGKKRLLEELTQPGLVR